MRLVRFLSYDRVNVALHLSAAVVDRMRILNQEVFVRIRARVIATSISARASRNVAAKLKLLHLLRLFSLVLRYNQDRRLQSHL